jgi:hypothetical protein
MTADERIALVRLKIERANKHIDDLVAAINAFHGTNPYKVGTKRNPETRQLIYYLVSLDHLAQQLYLAGSGASEYRDKTSFPLSPSAQDFNPSFVAKKTEGMRQDAIDAIRALEPYDGGKGADLWTLDRLNNIDKHRLITTVWSTLDAVGLAGIFSGIPGLPAHLEPMVRSVTENLFIRPADRLPLKADDELFIDLPDAERTRIRSSRFR